MRGTDLQAAGRLRDRHRGERTHPDLSDPGSSSPTSRTLTDPEEPAGGSTGGLCRAPGGHQAAAWSSASREGLLPRPAPARPWQALLPQAPAVQKAAGGTSSPASPARRAGCGWCWGSCRTRTPAPGRDLEEMKPRTPARGATRSLAQQTLPPRARMSVLTALTWGPDSPAGAEAPREPRCVLGGAPRAGRCSAAPAPPALQTSPRRTDRNSRPCSVS